MRLAHIEKRKAPSLALLRGKRLLAIRYLQLKSKHASIGSYLYRIKAIDSAACPNYKDPKETVEHALLHYRGWSQERKKLL